MLAVLAAYIAARPVFGQLKEMQAQTAVQTHEMLRRISGEIENERRLGFEARKEANYSVVLDARFGALDDLGDLIDFADQQWAERAASLTALIKELEIVGVRKWGDKDSASARNSIVEGVLKLNIAISGRRVELVKLKEKKVETRNAPVKLAPSTFLKDTCDEIEKACDKFEKFVESEVQRLNPKISSALQKAEGAGES
jgi:hypothetical protein